MSTSSLAITMHFSVAAILTAIAACASAKALVGRQAGVTDPATCLTATAPVLGTLDIITCSAGTCTTTATATQTILGEAVTFSVGVSHQLYLFVSMSMRLYLNVHCDPDLRVSVGPCELYEVSKLG